MIIKDVNHSHNTRSRFFYGYIVVAACFILQLVMFGTLSSFGIYFKPILLDFSWSRALISGAFSISTVVRGLAGIAMGHLNDKLGPRAVMTLCGFLLGIGYLLMSQINAAWQLYLFYVLIIGIGMGGLIAPQLSTIARWFVKRRNVMTGIAIAGGGTGGIFMPPLINWLIASYGWRDAYFLMGATVFVIVILTAQFLRRDPTQMGQVPFGEDEGGEKESGLHAEGLSLKEATYTRQFWMVFIVLFCFGFGAITVVVHLVPHITDLGISAATAANVLATMGATTLVGSIVMGIIANKIGNRRTLILSFILMSSALLWLFLAREIWMFYIFALVIGFVNGGITVLQSTLIAELFGIKSHGLILGICNFGSTTGAASGPFIAGYVFDVTGSYQSAFLACASLAFVGLILSAILRPIKNAN
ncbi:MFS transporter [Chloroflexota bacterium]